MLGLVVAGTVGVGLQKEENITCHIDFILFCHHTILEQSSFTSGAVTTNIMGGLFFYMYIQRRGG
jgi:hypothetical protein